MDGGPYVNPISPRELEPLQDVSLHRTGEAGSTNLYPVSQVKPRPIPILQQPDLRVRGCKPGPHRGKVQGDSPGLASDRLA